MSRYAWILGIIFGSGCIAEPTTDPELGRSAAPIIAGHACEVGAEAGPALLLVMQAKPADPTESPFLQGICTTSLIAPDTIVSAAHCFQIEDMTSSGFTDVHFFVSRVADASSLSSLPVDAVEVTAQVHPRFDPNAALEDRTLGNHHDVAIGFLRKPIRDIAPAVLPTRRERSAIVGGASVTIAGWGATLPEAITAGVLHCATSTIAVVGEAEIVVGPDAESARKCHGDSGGPTFITLPDATSVRKDRLIGITSRAYDRAACKAMGGVDTRVDAFRDWFDERMRAGCDDGARAWCDVKGVIPPSYYGGPAEPEEAVVETQGGCGVGSASHRSLESIFTLFGVIGFMLRRRARSLEDAYE